jgi:tetratricopeptide (TPR) repeat protein
MKRPRDPLLRLARRIAAGESPAAAELDDVEPGSARGMRRVAALARALRPDAPSGTTWGHLQRLMLAGSGSFGDVYRAWDPTLDRSVALKLRRSDAPGAIFSGRDFVAEAQRLARVRHPHVLAVHGAGYHDDRAGLWTDWIEGETLRDRLRRKIRLTPPAWLALARDLAGALAAVHEAGIVHGDISAGNVMLDRRGHALLMDFGAGFSSDEDAQPLSAGTPRYLAPEALRGDAVGSAADVYALGVLLHQAACGEFPAHDAGLQVASSLPPLLRSMLHPDPARRPGAAQVSASLERLAGAPLRRARRAMLGIGFAALALVAIASALGYRRAELARRDAEAALARSETGMRFLTELLGRAAPDALGPNATLRDLLDDAPALIEQRFAQRPADQAALFSVLATLEAGLADDEAASRLAQAAAEAQARIDPDGDAAWRLRGEALRRRAFAGESAQVLTEAEALYARASVEGRAPALRGALGVALTEVETRDQLERADPERRTRSIQRLEALLAEPGALDARDRPDALRRLAHLLTESGEHERGIELARRAVDAAEAGYGATHTTTALSRNMLAWYLLNRSTPDAIAEAERLLRRNLEFFADRVGQHSRTWCDNAMALAYALTAQRRHDEALPLAESAAKLAPELYGVAHRTTFDAQLTLATVYEGLQRDADARRVLEALRESVSANWGRDNRHQLLATRQLAYLLDERDPAASRELMRQCALDAERVLGAQDPIARDCRAALEASTGR